MKTKNGLSQSGGMDTETSIESTLRTYLRPVVPRDEFVDRLRGKLEQQVLPIQKKRVITFYKLLEVTLQTVGLLLITVFTVRLLLIILTTWKFLRTSNVR
ncbi:MAG: hypothetical protein ANABAC_0252 [Anaerolineae bacterium]|jgi:hypothetical protein|nr:MAG: hypothetical protein ANABAC_0252 [Anaerolineae bacterium]